jgi:hypothetical protein
MIGVHHKNGGLGRDPTKPDVIGNLPETGTLQHPFFKPIGRGASRVELMKGIRSGPDNEFRVGTIVGPLSIGLAGQKMTRREEQGKGCFDKCLSI